MTDKVPCFRLSNAAKKAYLAFLALLLAACAESGGVRDGSGISWNSTTGTPGAELRAQVVVRHEHAVLYEFGARGVPTNKTYALWAKWLDGNQVRIPRNLVIDRSTHLLIGLKPVIVNINHMFRGEPVEYQLISRDRKIRAFTRAVPFPLEATGQGNCRLTFELLSENGLMFFGKGQGFSPREEIKSKSVSGTEVLRAPLHASKDGSFAVEVLPGVIGKAGGLARFSAVGKACSVTLHYRWGAAMQRQ